MPVVQRGNAKFGRGVDRYAAGALQGDPVAGVSFDDDFAGPGSVRVAQQTDAPAVVEQQFAAGNVDRGRYQDFHARTAQRGNIAAAGGSFGCEHGIGWIMIAQPDFLDGGNIGNRNAKAWSLFTRGLDEIIQGLLEVEQEEFILARLTAAGHGHLLP